MNPTSHENPDTRIRPVYTGPYPYRPKANTGFPYYGNPVYGFERIRESRIRDTGIREVTIPRGYTTATHICAPPEMASLSSETTVH